jgi:hypothetical protein
MDRRSDHLLHHRAVVEQRTAHSFGFVASAQGGLFTSGVQLIGQTSRVKRVTALAEQCDDECVSFAHRFAGSLYEATFNPVPLRQVAVAGLTRQGNQVTVTTAAPRKQQNHNDHQYRQPNDNQGSCIH